MRRLPLFAALMIGFAGSAATAQTGESRKAPNDRDRQAVAVKGIAGNFLTLSEAGTWLGPEHWSDLEELVSYQKRYHDPLEITVVQDFSLRNPVIRGNRAIVDVDFRVWGLILSSPDSPFHFLRLEAFAPGQPVERKEQLVLDFSDSYLAIQDDRQARLKGPLKWRISDLAHPHISLEAAIHYVTEKRDSAGDPGMRAKADETLARLNEIKSGTLPRVHQGASGVVRDFLKLETTAGPDDWAPLDRFFLEAPNPNWNKVNVIDIVDTHTDSGFYIDGNKIELEISTNSLGQLDSSLRLFDYPSFRMPLVVPSVFACFGDDRFGFTLRVSSKHRETAPDGATTEQEAPLAWRIEDGSFEPLITLDAAIRYVREAGDKTTNAEIKRNAAKTLTILEYFKRGKELPHDLTLPEPGGCG